jgi:ribosomal protein S18 acetylase RimI-like enzyme
MTAFLRLARPGEEDALAEMHIAAWRETYRGQFPDDYLATLSLPRRTEQWRRNLGDADAELNVVEDDGTIVGFAQAGPGRQLTVADGELYAIYLLQSHQRQGLGRALMTRAAEYWLSRGGRTLALWVLTSNAPAIRFYRSAGGTVADRRSFTIGDTDYEEDAYLFDHLPRLASPTR